MQSVDIPYEIIVAGNTTPFAEMGIVAVHTPEDADNGLLAKLRNNAGEVAQYDAIVFADDDLIFTETWGSRLIEYSTGYGWSVLGNRVLLPDGGRYWDRATINPHTMVEYDDFAPQGTLYQSGCFWIIRKSVYEQEKWDSSIGYYAEKDGGINEDIELFTKIATKRT